MSQVRRAIICFEVLGCSMVINLSLTRSMIYLFGTETRIEFLYSYL